jgi:hypothetical protein
MRRVGLNVFSFRYSPIAEVGVDGETPVTSSRGKEKYSSGTDGIIEKELNQVMTLSIQNQFFLTNFQSYVSSRLVWCPGQN